MIRDIKNNIKFKFQRAKKGYCDYDLYDIDNWFIDIFPKMLGEFIECTCSSPADEEEVKKEILKMPIGWLELQITIINKIFKKNNCNLEYDLQNSFCCWLLILLRMKYCFERCDECHKDYDAARDRGFIEKHKKEAFYLLEKWFFDLWW